MIKVEFTEQNLKVIEYERSIATRLTLTYLAEVTPLTNF